MQAARVIAIAILIGITAAACTASLPTDPSFTAEPQRLIVHFPTGGTRTVVGGSGSFEAYSIDSDGVWARVTTQATWFSSDPQAIVPSTSRRGLFTYRNSGNHVIFANYQGRVGTLALEIRDVPPFPYLTIEAQSSSIGPTAFHTIYLVTSAATSGRQQLMTSQVTLSSSDPAIATVDQRGVFIPVAPGNARIIATRDGLSDFYWRSVPPRE
jgi:hypothetical protein